MCNIASAALRVLPAVSPADHIRFGVMVRSTSEEIVRSENASFIMDDETSS